MTEPVAPRAYEVAAHWVEERILAGELRVGDSLPAERELAGQLGVSRAAVREAVRSLQAQGVLRSTVGAGATGGTRVTAMPSGALTRLLRIHVALANFPLPDVVEVRVALERLSTRLAAAGAGAEDLACLQARLAELRTAAAQGREAFNDADAAFHVAIAEAAGNRLAADTTIAIRESVRAPMLRRFVAMADGAFAELAAQLNTEHEVVLEAITAGEAARAEELMEAHIRGAWSRMTGDGSQGAGGGPAGLRPVAGTMGA